jgi:hypothetical protein
MSNEYNVGLPVKFEGFHNTDCRDVITFWDDFLGAANVADADDSTVWLSSQHTWKIQGTGTADGTSATDAEQEMAGGLVTVTVEATASDCVSLLAMGESFNMDQGYPLYFECRFMNVDVSALQTFVGLTASDASAIAGVVNGIGFEGSGTTLSTICDNAGSTENVDATSITLADGTWYTVAFYYDGDATVRFYVKTNNGDWVLVNTLSMDTTADYVPQDLMLTPTIEAENAAADGSADLLYVDYMLVQTPRCRAAE